MRKNIGHNAKVKGFTKDAFIRLALLQCKLKSTIAHPHQLMTQIEAIRSWNIYEQKISLFVEKVVTFSWKIKQSKELLLSLIEILHLIPNLHPNQMMTILHLIIKNKKYMQAKQVQAYLIRGLNLMSKQIMNFGYIGLQFCLEFCFMTQNHNDFKIIMQRTVDILQVWVNQKFSQQSSDIRDSSQGSKTQFYIFSLFSLYKIGSMKFSTIHEQRQYNCRIEYLIQLLHKLGIKYKAKEINNYLQNPIFKQKVIKLKTYTEHNCNLIRQIPNVKPIKFHRNKQNEQLVEKIDKKRIRKIINIKKNENIKQDATNINCNNNNNKLSIDHQVISHNIEATIEYEDKINYNINIKIMQTSVDQIMQDRFHELDYQYQIIPVKSMEQFQYLCEEVSNNYISDLNYQLSHLDQVQQGSQKQIKSSQEQMRNNIATSYSTILSNNSLISNPNSSSHKISNNVQQSQHLINNQQSVYVQDIIKQLIEQQLQNDMKDILDKQVHLQQQPQLLQQELSMHTYQIQQQVQFNEHKQMNNKYIPYFNICIQNNNTYIHIFYYLKYAHHQVIAVFNYSSSACIPEQYTIYQIQSCIKVGRYFAIPFHILQSLSLVKDTIIHQTNYYFLGESNHINFLIYGVWVQTIQNTMKIMQNFTTNIQIMYTVYEVCYENHTIDIIISIRSIRGKRLQKKGERRLSQYGNEQQQTILGSIKINRINIDTIKNIHSNIQQIIGYNIQITKNKLIINQSINYQDIIPIIL